MTLKELSDAILKLPVATQSLRAVVWPPNACPAAQAVPIVDLVPDIHTPNGVVLSTGKTP